jgi:hypothetical protein
MAENNSMRIEMHTFRDGKAELRIAIALVNVTTVADRLHVEYDKGSTDDVLVFPVNGHRQVVKIRQTMTIQGPTPAVAAQTSFGEQLDNTPVEGERAQQLLAIYDLFEGRTYPTGPFG